MAFASNKFQDEINKLPGPVPPQALAPGQGGSQMNPELLEILKRFYQSQMNQPGLDQKATDFFQRMKK